MRTMAIDIETYSSVDIKKAGVYAYASAPDFTVLLFAYAYDNEPVNVLDLTTKPLPAGVLKSLTDPRIIKTAFNANFERTCLARFLNTPMPPEQWRCTAVHARTLGLPNSLAEVCDVLEIPAGSQKDSAGKRLIDYFCKPCKPTISNGGRTRNLPGDAPERWKSFIEYNRQDVVAERAVRQRLLPFPFSANEQKLWELDQHINDRGVGVDMPMVEIAISADTESREALTAQARKLTRLDNPNSVGQLKQWLEEQEGWQLDSLRKGDLKDLIAQAKYESTKAMLNIRAQLGKTSVKKYEAMQSAVCPDGRIRGLLQFYGGRTGRWAGRLVQLQNLPQNHLPHIEIARALLLEDDIDTLRLMYGNVSDCLSQLIRTALAPAQGCEFLVADFSAIEARVIAWLAGEKWRLDVFNSHGKIYEASAEKMFNLEPGSVKKGDPMRQKGKIAELALGYGGSVGALTAMGALDMGLDEHELMPLVRAWRSANTKITAFWWDVDRAVREAINGIPGKLQHGLRFSVREDVLFITLPGGRNLAYMRPRVTENDKITYEGLTSAKKWGRVDTYGPKIVENIVQAVARDCLATAMLRLDADGHTIVFHVHDEVIVEAKKGSFTAEHIGKIMSSPIPWAKGLPLRADGYACDFYMKD